MLQEFQNIFTFSLSLSQAMFNVFVAFLVGLIVSIIYRWTYQGTDYSSTFVNSLIILAMITAVVIMVIGNNLARAFGLVGAMSIIRFRTAVKNTQDIVFIFFSLAVGMAAGVGLHTISVTATIFIGLVMLVLFKSNYAVQNKREFLLQFSMNEEAEEASYLPVLQQYCKNHKLINAKTFGDQELMEISFYVQLQKQSEGQQFIKNLNRLSGIDNVNLYFDEEAL